MIFKNISNWLADNIVELSQPRKEVLNPLINYLNNKLLKGEPIALNFICTHNSRRSQLSQAIAAALAEKYYFDIKSESSGTEITELHMKTAETLKAIGFKISADNSAFNKKYFVSFAENKQLTMYSKLYTENNLSNYVALMTCDHANENCPFIPGAEVRFALNYQDPKRYDTEVNYLSYYLVCAATIANELDYVFKKLKLN